MKTVALSAEHLFKTYGEGDTAVHALNDVSFSMNVGEIVALLGPSGAGKSTLLTTLGLIQPPSSGTISIAGTRVFDNGYQVNIRDFRRNNIGFVFQKANLLPFLTAEENIRIAMEVNDASSRESKQYAAELLEHFELSARRAFLPKQLSGGQQQRVAIARAIVSKPLLLLADEPTGSLDSHRSVEIMQLLQTLNEEDGITIGLVTHEPEMATFAKRIVTFRDGLIDKG